MLQREPLDARGVLRGVGKVPCTTGYMRTPLNVSRARRHKYSPYDHTAVCKSDASYVLDVVCVQCAVADLSLRCSCAGHGCVVPLHVMVVSSEHVVSVSVDTIGSFLLFKWRDRVRERPEGERGRLNATQRAFGVVVGVCVCGANETIQSAKI